MTHYMVQMAAHQGRLVEWGRLHGLPLEDTGYLVHAALRAAFGDQAPQPFAYRERGTSPSISVLGYGRTDANSLRERAQAVAEPLLAKAIPLTGVYSKVMPEQWRAGLQFGFETRVCPIVRQKKNDGKATKETDIFIAAVGKVGASTPLDREALYRKWLHLQLGAGGAELLRAKIIAFRRVPVTRRGRDGKPGTAQKPDVTFRGALTVIDPEAFGALLRRGIGRHRAFGFGMLLLRPAEEPPTC